MRKLLALAAALALFSVPAAAQTYSAGQTGTVGTVSTCTDTSGNTIKCVVPSVTVSSGSTSVVTQPTAANLNAAVVGNVASAATDSGNPVKIGGKYSTTQPTLTDGQRGDGQLDTRGNLKVTLFNADSVSAASYSSGSGDGLTTAGAGILLTNSLTRITNGSGYDRAFTCANTASVNVTAGSTTEIVALTASQIIRVCSVNVSMSAAGTAKFVYGTGTNCATGATDIMAAMNLATATPWSPSATAGGSLFRSATANAICLTAVTGNVTGFITYAKF